MDLKVQLEILKNQVETLEDIFEEHNKQVEQRLSVCENFLNSIYIYYENILYKFGFINKKED